MTVKEYISQKFQTFGISLSEADLFDMCLGANVNGEDDMDDFVNVRVNVAMIKFVPSLLLRAKSVSENGFSMSWDIQGIMDFYSWQCKQYGVKDELSDKAKVTFL